MHWNSWEIAEFMCVLITIDDLFHRKWNRELTTWSLFGILFIHEIITRYMAFSSYGRPAEHRWRPLFNAAKFGSCVMPTTWPPCSNAAKTRKPLKLARMPQTGKPISAARGRRYSPIVPRWQFLATFLRPVFSASRMQHVSDLHLKFALRPHHV